MVGLTKNYQKCLLDPSKLTATSILASGLKLTLITYIPVKIFMGVLNLGVP